MEQKNKTDKNFYDRADAVIDVGNKHAEEVSRGEVSASMMYGVSRFNAWVSACGHPTAESMRSMKQETVEYFLGQYKAMLEENLDDYINNFDKYMIPKDKTTH